MSKRIWVFVLLALLMGSTAFASAPDRVNHVDIGVVGGGAFVDSSGIDDTGYIGLNLAYGITPNVAVGIEGGWWEADGSDVNDETVGAGNIMGDIIVRIPTLHDALVPYGILGLGFAGTYVTNENGNGANRGQDDYDGSFAWKLGGGLDWFVTEHWIANFEIAFVGTDPTFDTARTDVKDSDYWTVVGGVKYAF